MPNHYLDQDQNRDRDYDDNPEVVYVSGLDHRTSFKVVIRRDKQFSSRIFCEFPRVASITPDEAIALANRLADVLEAA